MAMLCRLLSISLLALLLSLSWPAPSSADFTDRYDDNIRKAAKMYWPAGPDWYWLKAQLYQESLLDPDAVSPVGATGIAQFMPGTWADVSRQMGFEAISPRDAKYAIQAGAFYMARLTRSWSSPRPFFDRHYLALASYNAGMGNILKAQRKCDGKLLYDEIICCLPAITGHHSKETITYVQRIRRWQREMRF